MKTTGKKIKIYRVMNEKGKYICGTQPQMFRLAIPREFFLLPWSKSKDRAYFTVHQSYAGSVHAWCMKYLPGKFIFIEEGWEWQD